MLLILQQPHVWKLPFVTCLSWQTPDIHYLVLCLRGNYMSITDMLLTSSFYISLKMKLQSSVKLVQEFVPTRVPQPVIK